MNLGAHISVEGGLANVFPRAAACGARAVQLFTKSERQWAARPLEDDAVAAFKKAREAAGVRWVFAHDSYLINLASGVPYLWKKSIDAFVEELGRAEALGLDFVVTHPGSPGAAGESNGLIQMVRGLDEIHRRTKGFKARILLETTAGQGTTVGWRFEHLAKMIRGVKEPGRVGVCFDTCHVFAAGYDLRTKPAYDVVMEQFSRTVGLEKIEAFHLNDSKKGLGCRVDRHEHIGKGELGLGGFRALMNDPRFADTPMVLETPKDDDMDAVNLKLLRGLRKSKKKGKVHA